MPKGAPRDGEETTDASSIDPPSLLRGRDPPLAWGVVDCPDDELLLLLSSSYVSFASGATPTAPTEESEGRALTVSVPIVVLAIFL